MHSTMLYTFYDQSVNGIQMKIRSQVRDVARNLTDRALHPTSGRSGILVSQIQIMSYPMEILILEL